MKKILIISLLVISYTDLISQVNSNLRCQTMGQPDGSQTQYNEIGYWLNNSPVEYNGCTQTPAIVVAVIDTYCNPWNTCVYNFGQYNIFSAISGNCSTGTGNCRNRAENFFFFQLNDSNQLMSMVNMLDSIPVDNYILAYTWYTFPYSTIPSFSSVFQSLGSSMITNLADNMPYIFFMKKGDPSSVLELTGHSSTDTLTLNTSISCLLSGVPEINNRSFRVYPNPASDFLVFDVERTGYEFKIYDLSGRMVLEKKAGIGLNKADISQLSNGSYQFYLTNDQEIKRTVFQKR